MQQFEHFFQNPRFQLIAVLLGLTLVFLYVLRRLHHHFLKRIDAAATTPAGTPDGENHAEADRRLWRDLIGAGKRPRPEFGPALAAAYNAQLDGLVSTKEDALAHAIVALEGNILRTLDGKEPGTPSLG